MSTFFVELEKVFQEQQEQQQKKAVPMTASAKPRGQKTMRLSQCLSILIK